MSYAANEYGRADHYRDLHKHDERPGDRLTPAISEALEIATLVRALKNPMEGAKLIEQFGNTRAAEGRLEGVSQFADRIAPPVQP